MQGAWEEVRAAFDQHTITQRLAPQDRAEWKAWATGLTPFSAPRLPWKGATAIWRRYITVIRACPSADTRCGRLYTTSIVGLRMVRHQRHDFSGGRFSSSLKRYYPITRSYLGLDNERTR
jgi:hypothetical protein